MPLSPDYGETPITDDEAAALLPHIRRSLGGRVVKAVIYDLEEDAQELVTVNMTGEVLNGLLTLDDLLSGYFLRELHDRIYGDIWEWAGKLRTRELNIGVAPEQIAAELHNSLGTIRYRWEHTADWTAHQLGIAAHAETVRIHPFTDGNGRTTRLLADLVFLAAQDDQVMQRYDWDVDKLRYLKLLRECDQHRDPRNLAALIPTRPLG
jgi:fido (protein-threonine AMPylation protein)